MKKILRILGFAFLGILVVGCASQGGDKDARDIATPYRVLPRLKDWLPSPRKGEPLKSMFFRPMMSMAGYLTGILVRQGQEPIRASPFLVV
jgi:hypothetical protein